MSNIEHLISLAEKTRKKISQWPIFRTCPIIRTPSRHCHVHHRVNVQGLKFRRKTFCHDRRSETVLIIAPTTILISPPQTGALSRRSADSRSHHHGNTRPRYFDIGYQASVWCLVFHWNNSPLLAMALTPPFQSSPMSWKLGKHGVLHNAGSGKSASPQYSSIMQWSIREVLLWSNQEWEGAIVTGHSMHSLIIHACICHLLSQYEHQYI